MTEALDPDRFLERIRYVLALVELIAREAGLVDRRVGGGEGVGRDDARLEEKIGLQTAGSLGLASNDRAATVGRANAVGARARSSHERTACVGRVGEADQNQQH